MRGRIRDAVLSCAAVAALLAALVIADDRVRDQLWRGAGTVASQGLSGGAELASVGPILLAAARDQSLAHGPMVVFAAAAAILFACMFRT